MAINYKKISVQKQKNIKKQTSNIQQINHYYRRNDKTFSNSKFINYIKFIYQGNMHSIVIVDSIHPYIIISLIRYYIYQTLYNFNPDHPMRIIYAALFFSSTIITRCIVHFFQLITLCFFVSYSLFAFAHSLFISPSLLNLISSSLHFIFSNFASFLMYTSNEISQQMNIILISNEQIYLIVFNDMKMEMEIENLHLCIWKMKKTLVILVLIWKLKCNGFIQLWDVVLQGIQ